jgi:hypothetical protein
MHSSLIGKIQKAKRYAEERDRIAFRQFQVQFRGDHDTYSVTFEDGRWSCGCHFFATWGTCSHVMAMERILGVMLPVSGSAAEVSVGAEAVAV